MIEHFTTCPIAQGTGTDCRCRGVVDAHEFYAAECVLTDGERDRWSQDFENALAWARRHPDGTYEIDCGTLLWLAATRRAPGGGV